VYLLKNWGQRFRHGRLSTEEPEAYRDEFTALVAAVVMQAVKDLVEHANRQWITLEEQREAFRWLFVEHGDRVFSLQWCCDALGCSVQDVRDYVLDHYPVEVKRLGRKWYPASLHARGNADSTAGY